LSPPGKSGWLEFGKEVLFEPAELERISGGTFTEYAPRCGSAKTNADYSIPSGGNAECSLPASSGVKLRF